MIAGEHAVEIRRRLGLLSSAVAADPFLSAVGAAEPSHRFLGNSTQAVYRRQVAFLAQILPLYTGRKPDGLSVLDWGCGKGQITYLLRKEHFVVVPSDLASDASDSAFGQPTPILREMGSEVVPLVDTVKLPFADASFDCVTSFGVLEHVTSDLGSLHEIQRVLRRNGILYVTFLPYFRSWTQALARLRGNGYHDRLYSRRRVRELAAQAGFQVEAMWLAQLFPKNSVPLRLDAILEPLDRALCRYTPLKFLATNLELILRAA